MKSKNFITAAFIILGYLTIGCAHAGYSEDQIDAIRAELSCQKDKHSTYYVQTKEKLNKLITQSKKDYSASARIKDVERLISEQKYNSALYELNDLIENNIEVSKSYEYLADIYIKINKPVSQSAKYYKRAIWQDEKNTSASFKLAKLYLREKRNILGIEYLKKTVENSSSNQYFAEIEKIILNNITPQDKYEANNLYEILGNLYLKSGRNRDAHVAFSKALELNPTDIGLKYQLANILYTDKQFDSAIIMYDSILNQNPNDSQIKLLKAKLLYQNGNISEAQQEYKAILREYPNSNQAKYGLYKLFQNRLSTEQILAQFDDDSSYLNNPNKILPFIQFLGEIKDNQAQNQFRTYIDDIKKKKEQQRKILEQKKQKEIQEQNRQKESVNSKIKQNDLKNKNQLNKIKQFEEEEIENKNKAINKAKKQNIAKEESSRQEKKQAKLKEKALEKEMKKAQEAQKAQAQMQAQIQAQKEKEKERLEYEAMLKNKQLDLEKELEEKRLEEEKRIKKIEQQKKNEQESAKKELDNVQRKNPTKYNECKKAVDNYLKITPLTAAIYTAIANTYRQANMPYNALLNYENAKKIEPLNSDIYYNIGLIYMELNKLSDAKDNLNKAINLNNDNQKAQTLLSFVNQKITTSIINSAYSDFENKKYIEAYSTLDNGIKEMPKNAQLYYYRGLVEEAMNRNAASIIDFQKAIELDPAYYMAYYYLGKCYEKINDGKSALIAYERFLSTEPDEKDLIEEIQKKVIILGKKYY